jgi:uncharacterized protein YkwD
MVRLRTSIVSLAALVALAACSDAPSATEPTLDATAAASRKPKPAPTTPTTEPAPTSPTPTAPTSGTGTTVTGCDGSAVALSTDEKAQLDLHNGRRAQLGLVAFCVHPQLTAAARAHSADMVAKNYFAHTSPSGVTFDARVRAAGYTSYTALAENIAWGSGTLGTASAIFDAWVRSAGHYANITNGGLREIGIGVAYGTFQGYSGASVWTADFGTRS